MISQLIGRGIGFSATIKFLITGGLGIGADAFDITNIVALAGVFDPNISLAGTFDPAVALAGVFDPNISLEGQVHS